MQTIESAQPQPRYRRQDWQRGYESQTQEIATTIEHITGTIPVALQGTLFRNGPGLMDINGERYHHPFDGDGMVCAWTFKNGRVHFQNRFVRTEGFVTEQTAGKICYRGVFGTQKAGGWLGNIFDLKMKNIANTNVLYWGDRLLALWEASLPHRLKPDNLETIGLDDWEGVLAASGAFSAHPRIDPQSARDQGEPCLVNFALAAGPMSTLHLYEFSPTGHLLRQDEQKIPGFAFIHDFAITPNYCLFFQNPIAFNPLPYLLGFQGAAQCIRFRAEQPTKIIVIPRHREAGSALQTLKVNAGFVFHHANAWEQDAETLYLESICYGSFPEVKPDDDFRETRFERLDPGQLWRFQLNLKTGEVARELCDPRCVEFPTLHPQKVGREHRYTYLAAADQVGGNAPLQALVKFDRQTGTQQFYSFAPGGFVSEPIFVPQPHGGAEDAGWVLMMVYDSTRHGSDLAIFDAAELEQGAIATLHLDMHIPYGLHGSWTPHCFVEF